MTTGTPSACNHPQASLPAEPAITSASRTAHYRPRREIPMLICTLTLTLIRCISDLGLAIAHTNDPACWPCYALITLSEAGHLAMLVWLLRKQQPTEDVKNHTPCSRDPSNGV